MLDEKWTVLGTAGANWLKKNFLFSDAAYWLTTCDVVTAPVWPLTAVCCGRLYRSDTSHAASTVCPGE